MNLRLGQTLKYFRRLWERVNIYEKCVHATVRACIRVCVCMCVNSNNTRKWPKNNNSNNYIIIINIKSVFCRVEQWNRYWSTKNTKSNRRENGQGIVKIIIKILRKFQPTFGNIKNRSGNYNHVSYIKKRARTFWETNLSAQSFAPLRHKHESF